MAEEKKSDGWSPNMAPVNEQRATPVRDGQPHAPANMDKKPVVKGTMKGPIPNDEVVLAFSREQRRKRTKDQQIRKAALDKHMKSFVPPKTE